MMFRTILATRKNTPFHPDIHEAMPFVADPSSMRLVEDLVMNTEKAENQKTFLGFRLPHESVWIEFEVNPGLLDVSENVMGADYLRDITSRYHRIGFLFKQEDNDSVVIYSFTQDRDGNIADPLSGIEFSTETGDAKAFVLNEVEQLKIVQITHAGGSPEDAYAVADELKDYGIKISAIGAVLGSLLFTLMTARDAPLDQVKTALMPRPERRRLERAGASPKGASRKVTRIVLNQEGRNYMNTIDGDCESGRPRRGHWVRGHLMRTESKGHVWRRSHVRGFGEPIVNLLALKNEASLVGIGGIEPPFTDWKIFVTQEPKPLFL